MEAYPARSVEKFVSCAARLPRVINITVAFVWNLGKLVLGQDAGEIFGHLTAEHSIESKWLRISVPIN